MYAKLNIQYFVLLPYENSVRWRPGFPARYQLGGFGVGLVCSVAGRTSGGETIADAAAGTADDGRFTLKVPAGLM